MPSGNRFLNHLFLPDSDDPESSPLAFWISTYLTNRTVFHAVLYSQLVRIGALENQPEIFESQKLSICHAEVVRGVNKSFDNPSTRCSDDTILAVLALAFHGKVMNPNPVSLKPPSQGPMNAMQCLDIFGGRLDTVPMHLMGLQRMLSIRGGLENVKFPGLAAIIS